MKTLRAVWILAATASATLADGAAEVQRIKKEYRALASNQDHMQVRRRRTLARRLAAFADEEARDLLLEVLKKDASIRVRVEALRSLGAVGDTDALAKAVRLVNRQARTVLPQFLGEALARNRDPEVPAWLVDKLLRHRNDAIRLAAVEAAAELRPPGARERLEKIHDRNVRKPSGTDLAYESLRALGRLGGQKSEALLLAAATSKQRHLRLAVAEVLLGHADTPRSRAAVETLLQDEDAAVREQAALSIGATKTAPMAPLLFPCLASDSLRLRIAARASLGLLAGKDLGADAQAWSDWWKNRDGEREGVTSARRTSEVRIHGNRVVLMLDMSLSMTWPASWGPSRLEVARTELIELIRSLREPTHFDVLTLSGYVDAWADEARPATPANIERALAWLAKQQTRLCTSTYDGFKKMFAKYPALDTFYFLSDGSMPVGGNYREPEELLAYFRQENRLRKVVVHTRSYMWGRGSERFWKYEDQDDLAEFMRRLAEQSGGTFTDRRHPHEEASR